ncbi:hypothetical protein K523DRAFT_321799 [Schizophyllum commune Tattone D]|nr:hypothetical protein K523DRAFT_321799 [Schizophyllum commune Tattone D]
MSLHLAARQGAPSRPPAPSGAEQRTRKRGRGASWAGAGPWTGGAARSGSRGVGGGPRGGCASNLPYLDSLVLR